MRLKKLAQTPAPKRIECPECGCAAFILYTNGEAECSEMTCKQRFTLAEDGPDDPDACPACGGDHLEEECDDYVPPTGCGGLVDGGKSPDAVLASFRTKGPKGDPDDDEEIAF